MTIVVLIILATISINVVLGEDGLIKKAEKAAQMQANAEASDNEAMDALDKYISDTMSHGLHFGQPYTGVMDGMTLTVVFYEDGRMDTYANGMIMESIPAGGCTYDKQRVYAEEKGVCTISEDGTIVTSEGVALTLNTSPHDLYYGDFYTLSIDSDNDGVDDVFYSFVIEENGALDVYSNYALETSIPAQAVVREGNRIEVDGLVITISIDGTQIIVPGEEGMILTHEIRDIPQILFGQPYGVRDETVVNYDTSWIYYIFAEDGSVNVYRNGRLLFSKGTITYKKGSLYYNGESIGIFDSSKYTILSSPIKVCEQEAPITSNDYIDKIIPSTYVGECGLEFTVSYISGDQTFSYDATSVYIPKTITHATGYVLNDFTDIYYEGTEEDWNNIVGISADNLNEDITFHYNHVLQD